jgi:hypothetical protein
VRQRGKEGYKLKLTNKNYKYYNGLESRVVNVTWKGLVSLAFICQVFSRDWIARREAWSFWETVTGSQSVATTAES